MGLDVVSLVESGERVQNLLLTEVIANPDQPRRQFDQESLKELAQSIDRHGVLQPIIVSPSRDGTYIIVAGERRWRASQLTGLDRIPAIVRERQELEQLEIALIENVQRVDLSPLEQAVSIERLYQQFNVPYGEIGKRLGKAETTINNIVRLLQLPTHARDALQNRKITEGHARQILALKNSPELQEELLTSIIQRGWSVRQAEQFVTAHKHGARTAQAAQEKMASETPQTKALGQKFRAKVTIKHTARGGRLEIHFKSEEELNNLLKTLS
jgi:ParB family chromosome partitioning protein